MKTNHNIIDPCMQFGLNYSKIEIYGDIILINEPNKDLYILFDKNYNVIGVEKNEKRLSNEEFVREFNERYSTITFSMLRKENKKCIFDNYSLKNIIDLATTIDKIEYYQGKTLQKNFDDRNSYTNEVSNSYQILDYIKVLNELIKNYFPMYYHLKSIGCDVPNIYTYLINIDKKLNECIDETIKNKKYPLAPRFLEELGLKINYSLKESLYSICDILLQQRELKQKIDSLKELEISEPTENLNELSLKLLNISNLTNEEIEKGKTLSGKNIFDINIYIEENTKSKK